MWNKLLSTKRYKIKDGKVEIKKEIYKGQGIEFLCYKKGNE